MSAEGDDLGAWLGRAAPVRCDHTGCPASAVGAFRWCWVPAEPGPRFRNTLHLCADHRDALAARYARDASLDIEWFPW